MTCFSIQKYLRILLAFALIFAFSGLQAAMAQPEPPAEEVAKIKARDEARKIAREKKTDAPIVIELFTASDCTACIFADRMLYDAMKDKQVIALSCHIQDFNQIAPGEESADRRRKNDAPAEFIGEDSASKGAMDPCVFRQWAYASSNRSEDVTVNIPTFYFNGSERVDGDGLDYFNIMFNAYHYTHRNKTLEAMMRWKDKDTISVHLPQSNAKGDKPKASVWLVRYKDMDVERMDAGMNKGRVLRFSNIIQSITHVGKWHGDIRTIDIDVAPPEGGKQHGGYVILVSEMLGDPFLAAGKLVDYPVAADLKDAAEKKARAKAASENKLKAVPSEKTSEELAPIIRQRGQ